jgi:hypothetical protein
LGNKAIARKKNLGETIFSLMVWNHKDIYLNGLWIKFAILALTTSKEING